MKFNYQYRTKDNVQHEGSVNAADREAAFALLKSQGIKPGRLEEAPGVFNKLFGKGKRWIAISVLALALVAAIVLIWSLRDDVATADAVNGPVARSHIYGDPIFLKTCEQLAWANVFEDAGTRFLAWYAQPGVEVELKVNDAWMKNAVADLTRNRLPPKIYPDDQEEVRKMKRIVAGMKYELAQYVAAGGKVATYVERVIERQRVEVEIAARIKREMEVVARKWVKAGDENEAVIARWNEKNELLRDMGMEAVQIPDEWEQKIFENTHLQDSEKKSIIAN